MITVTITFFSFIKFETGLDEIQVSLLDKATIADLVQELRREYGQRLSKFLYHEEKEAHIALFMMNNQMCPPEYVLSDSDDIKILPTVAGG